MASAIPRPSAQTIVSNLFNRAKSAVVKPPEPRECDKLNNIQLSDFGSIAKHEEFDEFGGSGEKISEWQAGWNVTNAIQGMFLVSLPFAVLHGGWWAIFAMIAVAYICCHTGKILVECLYEPDANGVMVRVRDSYMSIASECFGPKYGPKVVVTAQMIELLMTCILYLVLCGDLMIGTFPEWSIDSRSWMMICGMFLIPCAFLKDLHSVSTLSFYCTVAHLFINFIIIAYCLASIGHWDLSQVSFGIDMDTFPISLGIIVFSYTSHIFLPTLEGNMLEPEKFNQMLDYSHIAAAAFKSGFGFIAFLTWQASTMQVITNNLPYFWKALVNIILVAKAVLSFPLPYYAAVDLLEKIFWGGEKRAEMWDKENDMTMKGCIFRVGVIVGTIIMSVTIPHFGILMGFIGNFTGTMLSFIWPCYFHLKLKGGFLQLREVCLDCFIIFIGFLFGTIGIFDSGRAMIEAFQIGLPF